MIYNFWYSRSKNKTGILWSANDKRNVFYIIIFIMHWCFFFSVVLFTLYLMKLHALDRTGEYCNLRWIEINYSSECYISKVHATTKTKLDKIVLKCMIIVQSKIIVRFCSIEFVSKLEIPNNQILSSHFSSHQTNTVKPVQIWKSFRYRIDLGLFFAKKIIYSQSARPIWLAKAHIG